MMREKLRQNEKGKNKITVLTFCITVSFFFFMQKVTDRKRMEFFFARYTGSEWEQVKRTIQPNSK